MACNFLASVIYGRNKTITNNHKTAVDTAISTHVAQESEDLLTCSQAPSASVSLALRGSAGLGWAGQLTDLRVACCSGGGALGWVYWSSLALLHLSPSSGLPRCVLMAVKEGKSEQTQSRKHFLNLSLHHVCCHPIGQTESHDWAQQESGRGPKEWRVGL